MIKGVTFDFYETLIHFKRTLSGKTGGMRKRSLSPFVLKRDLMMSVPII